MYILVLFFLSMSSRNVCATKRVGFFRNFPFLFVFSGFPFERVRAKKKLDQNSKKINEKKTKSHRTLV